MPPPPATSSEPTVTTTWPLRPLASDAPLPNDMEPEWPDVASPEENDSKPLTPLLPASGVVTTMSPLDVAADAPVEKVRAPPDDDAPRPPGTPPLRHGHKRICSLPPSGWLLEDS